MEKAVISIKTVKYNGLDRIYAIKLKNGTYKLLNLTYEINQYLSGH